MKLLVFVTFVACLFQAYYAAPTADDTELLDAAIRLELESFPGMDEQMIPTITTLLHKYENDTLEIFMLAVQGDTCLKNRIDLRLIFSNAAVITAINEQQAKMYGETINFAEEYLDRIKNSLSRTLTPEKVESAMKVIRSFENHEDEKKKGTNLYLAAAKAYNEGCPTEAAATTESVAKE